MMVVLSDTSKHRGAWFQNKLLEECNKLWDAPIEDAMPAAYPMQDFSAFRLLTKALGFSGLGLQV